MTYPPPGGENPQYQLQPEPQPPTDPYMQGYGSTPPPGNYYQQQPNYTQPQSQPLMPPVGVQQGYPTAPGSVLPPPIPPAQQGGNLGVILAVIVGLVVVLGVAAVLIIPGMLNDDDDDPQAGGGDATTSEEPEPEPTEEEPEPDPTPTEAAPAGGLEGWDAPISSDDDFDPKSPVGVAISYVLAGYSNDNATLESLVSSNPTESMAWDLDYELNDDTSYDFLIWGVSREYNGEVQAWAGWTWTDEPPASEDDLSSGYTYTLVEENGEWKLYDLVYGAP
ncbi:hypothetical protein [Glycomyces sp. NRRL B-16210]|uniref:hypothetical protein n=1 Tax=Glycomyces sp. NRRL B-16210 TaxID=1463821 RepID=UPI0004C16DF0|nr:hypothetical protein [Glycomyces sp. NRRL B-16210]